MKKRILSFVLMLSMLISLFTVFATGTSAASGDEGTPSAQSSGSSVTYLDLYVKDGLVALFDAYGAKASTTAITTWSPVDLYGKAGYNDYLAATEYSFYSNKTAHTWYSYDGYIAPTLNSGANAWSYTCLNVDAIGAVIGTDYSVQEVYDPFAFGTASQVEPVLNGTTVTNFEQFSWGMNCDPNFQAIGAFILAGYGVTLQNSNGHNMLYGYIEQATWDTGTNWIHNYYFCLDAYGAKKYTCSDGAAYWVEAPHAVLEKTVYRPTPTANGDGTYNSTLKVNFFFGNF